MRSIPHYRPKNIPGEVWRGQRPLQPVDARQRGET